MLALVRHLNDLKEEKTTTAEVHTNENHLILALVALPARLPAPMQCNGHFVLCETSRERRRVQSA